jgi:hypothetical protein
MADNHGNTPAAWAAVLVALVGFVVGAIGMSVSPLNWPLFWVGCALVGIAAVVFLVLSRLGLHGPGH